MERPPLNEYANAPWWELASEPGRICFILFHRKPGGAWLVQDVQDKLWLVRSQEKVLRDAGFETFVSRALALPHDPTYSGIYPQLAPDD